jgi:hypothetical protein
MSEPVDKEWHLDKRVPIGIIAAIVFQTITFVALGSQWMAKMEARVDVIERSMDERRTQGDRLIILEQKLGFISETVSTIARKLDRFEPRKDDRLQ